jgi:hypothetical protein
MIGFVDEGLMREGLIEPFDLFEPMTQTVFQFF